MRIQFNSSVILGAFAASLMVLSSAHADVGASTAAPTDNRFVDLQSIDGSLVTRYQYQTDANGHTIVDDLQYKVDLNVNIGFFNDRVMLNIEGQTGDSFGNSYDPLNGPNASTAFNVKWLTLSSKIGKGVELMVGSMRPELGEGSDATYMNQDGYIMGYRAKVSMVNGSIVVTGGYVGNQNDPSVFDRMGQFGDSNYLQVVLNHSIGEIIKASLDYTRLGDNSYGRAAVKVDVSRWASFVDSITLEDLFSMHQSGGGNAASAYAVTLSKKFQNALGGNDVNVALAYLYSANSSDFGYAMSEDIMDGRSVRLRIGVPILNADHSSRFEVYVQVQQSLDNGDQRRVELGGIWKF